MGILKNELFEKYGDEPTIMDAVELAKTVGGRDWTGNKRTTWATLGATNHTDKERAENDFYESPEEAITRLLAVEELRPTEGSVVWECACGRGALSRPLQAAGYTTYDTDLVNRGWGASGMDFLKSNRPFPTEINMTILTNPPFKYSLEFCQHSVDLMADGERTYMLLRLSFLEGQKREKWFNSGTSGLRYVAVFGKRITCNRNGIDCDGKGAVAYAWFCFEKGYTGRPEILWI